MGKKTRQSKYPKEFRIQESKWPPDMVATFDKMTRSLPSKPAKPKELPRQPREDMRWVANVGTGLWRLRQKMLKPGTNEPLEETRRLYRYVESMWDALAQAGVEIHDHTQAVFDSGLSLKVVAFQPTAGFTREIVVETIKPTIYFKNERLQMGEVIVGTPEKTEPSQDGAAP